MSTERPAGVLLGAMLTDLDLAGAGKTASTVAGSEATAARAVLPDPTSLSSGFTPKKKYAFTFYSAPRTSSFS